MKRWLFTGLVDVLDRLDGLDADADARVAALEALRLQHLELLATLDGVKLSDALGA